MKSYQALLLTCAIAVANGHSPEASSSSSVNDQTCNTAFDKWLQDNGGHWLSEFSKWEATATWSATTTAKVTSTSNPWVGTTKTSKSWDGANSQATPTSTWKTVPSSSETWRESSQSKYSYSRSTPTQLWESSSKYSYSRSTPTQSWESSSKYSYSRSTPSQSWESSSSSEYSYSWSTPTQSWKSTSSSNPWDQSSKSTWEVIYLTPTPSPSKMTTEKATIPVQPTITSNTVSTTRLICNADNCLRALRNTQVLSSAQAFCSSYTSTADNPAAFPTYVPKECNASRVSSACSCLPTSSATSSGASPSSSSSITGSNIPVKPSSSSASLSFKSSISSTVTSPVSSSASISKSSTLSSKSSSSSVSTLKLTSTPVVPVSPTPSSSKSSVSSAVTSMSTKIESTTFSKLSTSQSSRAQSTPSKSSSSQSFSAQPNSSKSSSTQSTSSSSTQQSTTTIVLPTQSSSTQSSSAQSSSTHPSSTQFSSTQSSSTQSSSTQSSSTQSSSTSGVSTAIILPSSSTITSSSTSSSGLATCTPVAAGGAIPQPSSGLNLLSVGLTDAPYSLTQAELLAGISFPNGLDCRKNLVILFPGTAVPALDTFTSTFIPVFRDEAVAEADVLVMSNPSFSLGDAQTTAEYAAFAINYAALVLGRRATIIPWSQGNLNTQWALKYWPSTRPNLKNYVGMSPDYDGTLQASFLCDPGTLLTGNVPKVLGDFLSAGIPDTLASILGIRNLPTDAEQYKLYILALLGGMGNSTSTSTIASSSTTMIATAVTLPLSTPSIVSDLNSIVSSLTSVLSVPTSVLSDVNSLVSGLNSAIPTVLPTVAIGGATATDISLPTATAGGISVGGISIGGGSAGGGSVGGISAGDVSIGLKPRKVSRVMKRDLRARVIEAELSRRLIEVEARQVASGNPSSINQLLSGLLGPIAQALATLSVQPGSVLEEVLANYGGNLAMLQLPAVLTQGCLPALWQQVYFSSFVNTLATNYGNGAGDTVFVPTTTVFSISDEVVQPQGITGYENASGFIKDGSNIFIQGNGGCSTIQSIATNVLPSVITHEGVLYSGMGVQAAILAVQNGGMVTPDMIAANIRCQLVHPLLNVQQAVAQEATIPGALARALVGGGNQVLTDFLPAEPPIRSYATRVF